MNPPPNHRFPRALRLRTQAEFDRVYQRRAFAADGVLIVNGCWNDVGHPRLGLSVSRKVGNAVMRNRWKRRIREAFRLAQHQLPALDLVVRPQKGATADFQAISRSLPQLAERIARKLARQDSA